MRLPFILLLLFYFNVSFSQSIDFETEKSIIKQTLSQYLDTNPNSIASYQKENKGYHMLKFGLKMGFVIEEDYINKENLKKELIFLDTYADSISNILKTKKSAFKLAIRYMHINTLLQTKICKKKASGNNIYPI